MTYRFKVTRSILWGVISFFVQCLVFFVLQCKGTCKTIDAQHEIKCLPLCLHYYLIFSLFSFSSIRQEHNETSPQLLGPEEQNCPAKGPEETEEFKIGHSISQPSSDHTADHSSCLVGGHRAYDVSRPSRSVQICTAVHKCTG